MSALGPFGALARDTAHRNYWWALIALVAGLVGAVAFFRFEQRRLEAKVAADFDAVFGHVTQSIDDRIQAHRQILLSGAAMVTAADGATTREEWSVFAGRQRLRQTLPGIEGFGFTVLVPQEQLAEHLAKVRAEGFPDYRVRPEGDRPLYSSIVYLEPFSGRNLRAFGYDMYSEPVRREAMQRACDEDQAILSGPVVLVQETDIHPQVGTLMYVPVFRKGANLDSVEARRRALLGWVYSPYRMNDLLNEILDRSRANQDKEIQVQIFDGETAEAGRRLFERRHEQGGNGTGDHMYVRDHKIDAAGRTWLLRFSVDLGRIRADYLKPAWYALGGGTLLSLLLAGLVFSVLNTKYHARRKAEQLTSSLLESEARWKFAIEGSGVGVYDWDLATETVIFSRRWKELLGYKDHEIGQGFSEWRDRVHPEDLPDAEAKVEAHLQGRSNVFRFEYRMRTKDGSWKWFLSTGQVVLRDPDGRPLRVVGTNDDITAAKQHEENLATMLERERRVSEMKTRFVSVTSHEFRTPLAAAMASIELLLNHPDRITPKKHLELHGWIKTSLRRMTDILDEMLIMNRIEEGRVQISLAPIELRQVVQSMVDEAKLVDRDAHPFSVQAPAALWLETDPSILRHIVTNLLSNAARYSPPNREITLSVEVDGEWILLTVEDRGIGIPPVDLERIFAPFERGTNIGQIKGTGLGLNIVKRMTEILGGTVAVESKEGEGSRFTVRLPFRPVAPFSTL